MYFKLDWLFFAAFAILSQVFKVFMADECFFYSYAGVHLVITIGFLVIYGIKGKHLLNNHKFHMRMISLLRIFGYIIVFMAISFLANRIWGMNFFKTFFIVSMGNMLDFSAFTKKEEKIDDFLPKGYVHKRAAYMPNVPKKKRGIFKSTPKVVFPKNVKVHDGSFGPDD